MAIRPPSRSTRRSSWIGVSGSGQNCATLMQKALSKLESGYGSRAAEPSCSSTRPARMPAALRRTRLLQHDLGVIDARDKPVHGNFAHAPDIDARSESDLEYTIPVVNLKQGQHPPTALFVSKCHQVAGQLAQCARGPRELVAPSSPGRERRLHWRLRVRSCCFGSLVHYEGLALRVPAFTCARAAH